MQINKLIQIAKNFKGKKIGVIGDLMLDHFIWGDVERISPEAPVPVILVEKETFIPGGAANTANNIAHLGGSVFLIGIIGSDSAGEQLTSELNKNKINIDGLFLDKNRATTQKIRVIARGQHVVRVDKEEIKPLTAEQEKKILGFISRCIPGWDGIVVSDYAKGLITKNLAETIVNLAVKYKKPIISDAKPKHAPFFKNVTLLSPNHKEALEIAGASDIRKAGKIIQKQLNCSVLLTQGAEGVTLFENNRIKHFPAMANEALDISGAGDTVVATATLALAAGANLEQASIIANYAAGIAVGKLGTATVTLEELKKGIQSNESED